MQFESGLKDFALLPLETGRLIIKTLGKGDFGGNTMFTGSTDGSTTSGPGGTCIQQDSASGANVFYY